jgi:hypothetical protein
MDIRTAIECKHQEIAKASVHPAVVHINALTQDLEILLAAQNMLAEADTKAEKAANKPVGARGVRRGSIAARALDALKEAHAFGMTADELSHALGTVAMSELKVALGRHIGSTIAYDFVSGLYSLKSREGERHSVARVAMPDRLEGQHATLSIWDDPTTPNQSPEAVAKFLNSIPPAAKDGD